MTSIYICDDEPAWIELIERTVSDYQVRSDWELAVLCRAASPEELLACLKQHQTSNGIYFLDVGLKSEINGIELGIRIRHLDPSAFFIFITTHEEMAIETYYLKLRTENYISKNRGSLRAQVGDALHTLELQHGNAAESDSRIRLSTGSSYSFIQREDIYFVESQKNRHKLLIHLRSELITASVPLKDMAGQLGEGFLLCSRGCLINPRHVIKADSATREITFDNQEKCICSFRAWRSVLEKISV